MSKRFSSIFSHMKTYLSYSEIFGIKSPLEEVKQDIRSINLDEALTILSMFSVLDKESMTSLKNKLLPFVRDKEFINSLEVFDVSNLMYAMKCFIAYGTRNPYYKFNNSYDKPYNVFLTVLKITDYMIDNIDTYEDVQDVVLKGALFHRSTELDRSLLRQHIMFEELAREVHRFEKNEFIDIHQIFEMKFGYTIAEYVATAFSLNLNCIKGCSYKDIVEGIDWGINPDLFFKNVSIKDKALAIYKDLCIDPLELRDWARSTIKNPYDFEPLLVRPIFSSGNKAFPSSPGNMNAVIFDGLFFKIRRCFETRDTSFFDFFGRLFEIYVSDMLKAAVKASKISAYNFIDEFSYGKDLSKRSSDAYIQLGKSLLIVECKSGRIRKETKLEADEKTTEEDFKKYVTKPIMQASKAYSEILDQMPEKFGGAKKVCILSVSYQSFPRLPRLHYDDQNWQKDLSPNVNQFDYLGLMDIEIIAYIIENLDISIFRFLNTKITNKEFVPYPNYFYKKFGDIRRLKSHSNKLEEIFDNIKKTLGFKKS
ncbi:hypothetical protein [Halobacillus amylolyticus]|uniref:NERD domain-containing protein n=1 Tax=Halobacillus amylolyticus TaxID=2932259 RepID=A0ABY4HA44_9BACI|nr:hypothetical protein [Halobacillus amylolyticus]UOR11322.1 hypothetical protein MUO15_17245 [Halobacillus amylolyticus]